ncbi:hypothetical protein Ocin01_15633 [Orchesella cincta]|uniref:Uncharacterized protein n=1 Tax=Orchesella cincta TaxID=48709 RepID=A0A1D2MDF5_ORCCI|nr:hypothetical protein Ocin01_15633 [Orchesella cincta]
MKGLALIAVSSVNALDLDQVQEAGSCGSQRNAPRGTPVNMDWLYSVPTWYINGGSKSHLYAITLEHFGGNDTALEAIREDQFYYEACLTHKLSPGESLTFGYEPGRVSLYTVRQAGPGVLDFIRTRNVAEAGVSRHVSTLTDNQSFVVFTNCELQTNRRTWDIWSTQPQVSAAVRRRIEEHAISQGFARENIAFLRYDSCRAGVVPNTPKQQGGQRGNRNQQRGSSSGVSYSNRSLRIQGSLKITTMRGFEKLFGLALLAVSSVSALDMGQVEEGFCDMQPTVQESVNMEWVNSVPRWFVSAGSKLHLYGATLHHFGGNKTAFDEMREDEFYYENCMNHDHIDSGVLTAVAFETGMTSRYEVKHIAPGQLDYIPIVVDNEVFPGISHHFITLTDNQSFVFFTNCNSQTNRKSWDLATIDPDISLDVVRRIEGHAIAQGFSRENFAFLRFNSCQPGVVPNTPKQQGGRRGNRNQQRGSSSGISYSNRSNGKWNKNLWRFS